MVGQYTNGNTNGARNTVIETAAGVVIGGIIVVGVSSLVGAIGGFYTGGPVGAYAGAKGGAIAGGKIVAAFASAGVMAAADNGN